MSAVLEIYIAPRRGAPMESRRSAVAVADSGLDGDRYAIAKNRRSPDYQVTLIEVENIDAYRRTIDWSFTNDLPRRNIVTQGIALNEVVGKRVRVGEVVLEGLELCEPCSLFAERTRREVLKAFLHRGGLRARIRTTGTIRVGDLVEIET